MDLLLSTGYSSSCNSSDTESSNERINEAKLSISNLSESKPDSRPCLDKIRKLRKVSTNDVKGQQFIRAVPHIRGNWAGHIYADLDPSCEDTVRLMNVLQRHVCRFSEAFNEDARLLNLERVKKGDSYIPRLFSHITNSYIEEVTEVDSIKHDFDINRVDVHISLSRSFFLHESSIASFERKFFEKVSSWRTQMVHLLPLRLAFSSDYQHTELLNNDTSTRSFLTVPVVAGHHALIEIIKNAVDPVLREFHQATYYENPKMHISIASFNNCESKTLKNHKNSASILPVKQVYYKDSKAENKTFDKTRLVMPCGIDLKFCDPLFYERQDNSRKNDDASEIITVSVKSITCMLGAFKKIVISLS